MKTAGEEDQNALAQQFHSKATTGQKAADCFQSNRWTCFYGRVFTQWVCAQCSRSSRWKVKQCGCRVRERNMFSRLSPAGYTCCSRPHPSTRETSPAPVECLRRESCPDASSCSRNPSGGLPASSGGANVAEPRLRQNVHG